MGLKLLTISMIICLALLSSGCYKVESNIPKSLFDEVSIFDKPKQAFSIEDINKSYLDLWTAYKNNLLLLDTIKKTQNF